MRLENKAMLLASQGIIWLVFTMIYYVMEMQSPGEHFGDDFSAPYFATITQTTVGFGDITPKTYTSRMIVSLHVTCASLAAIVLL
jgi:hypothetical protein